MCVRAREGLAAAHAVDELGQMFAGQMQVGEPNQVRQHRYCGSGCQAATGSSGGLPRPPVPRRTHNLAATGALTVRGPRILGRQSPRDKSADPRERVPTDCDQRSAQQRQRKRAAAVTADPSQLEVCVRELETLAAYLSRSRVDQRRSAAATSALPTAFSNGVSHRARGIAGGRQRRGPRPGPRLPQMTRLCITKRRMCSHGTETATPAYDPVGRTIADEYYLRLPRDGRDQGPDRLVIRRTMGWRGDNDTRLGRAPPPSRDSLSQAEAVLDACEESGRSSADSIGSSGTTNDGERPGNESSSAANSACCPESLPSDGAGFVVDTSCRSCGSMKSTILLLYREAGRRCHAWTKTLAVVRRSTAPAR